MSLELGGLHIPDGLVVPSCTSHPGVLGLVPKREEPGKTGARSLSRSPSLPRTSFTQSPFPPRSLVRDGQTSPHSPRLGLSRR